MNIIKLNAPDLNKGISVMQALEQRKTVRELGDRKLSLQHLSEVLWAANGVNRESGKRTAPSAIAQYPVDIYAVLEEGAYLYDIAGHQLSPVAQGDFRKDAGTQDYVFSSPLNLIYAGDFGKLENLPAWATSTPVEKKQRWMALEAGHMVENVYLYCASEGLATVVRGLIDSDKFGKILKLSPKQTIICAQTVGHPK
jgi:nitroreductase